MNKLQKIFRTNDGDYSSMILRILLGVIMFPHGAQKLFGMFGGAGFEATMGGFTEGMGLPFIVALLVILGESLGALALIVGFASRFMAFGIFVIMTGAMLMAHLQYGFFINWQGAGAGNGIEFHILVIVISLIIMRTGGGAYAFDSVISKWLKK